LYKWLYRVLNSKFWQYTALRDAHFLQVAAFLSWLSDNSC